MLEPERLKPGDRLPLTDGRTATVVGLRKIEDINEGSYMISMPTGDLVQADGWSRLRGRRAGPGLVF